MARSKYHGKRGGNAGDEFHELWALRRALETISPRSSVQQVTVEGIRPEDAPAGEGPEWDGVDCAIFHGPAPSRIERIELAQLKYSGASPDAPWTVARFTSSDAKPGKRNNSVAARLSEAWAAIVREHAALARKGAISIKLVSNQPADAKLQQLAAGKGEADDRKKIGKATKLSGQALTTFLEALDLSECGSIGYEGLEQKFIEEIAEWDDIDADVHMLRLRRQMNIWMLPEEQRTIIDAETILGIFNSANPRTLFPCPPEFETVGKLIPREVSREIAALWAAGEQRICLHGEGGEGKTTVLADLARLLPANSLLVAFDCYGTGSYLNSNAYRHKPQDAFVQLTNEFSSSLLLPLLLTQSRSADYPRIFMRRLEQAAAALAESDPSALLIVAVDAADNSITAAREAADRDPSFVPAFLYLGDPPANVRFLVSARTGRLEELALPSSYKQIAVGAFSPAEVGALLEEELGAQPEDWLQRVHGLSDGNPRVLRYALEAAGGNAGRLHDYLAPGGTNLSGIFTTILEEAFKKAGAESDVRGLCAAMSLLPRPMPISALAAVSGHKKAHVRDILADLRPGVVVAAGMAGFRDEDFEHFIRKAGGDLSVAMLERAADFFTAKAKSDAYAAEHAATILLRAGRHPALLDLASQDINEYPVTDPAARTVIHETRMRAALRICRTAGDLEAAMKLLLTGADAFRRDAAIRELLFENADLAAHFSRDQMRRIFLVDPDQRPRHGAFLMHAIAAGADEDAAAEIEQDERSLKAWFQSRTDFQRAERRKSAETAHYRYDWRLDAGDLAAYAVGRIERDGAEAGLAFARRARPPGFRASIFRAIIERLARTGDIERLEQFITLFPRRYPLIGLAQLFPALAGRPFDLEGMLSSLEAVQSRFGELLAAASESYGEPSEQQDLLEAILSAIEIALLHKAPRRRVAKLLEALASPKYRGPTAMNRSATASNNIAIRSAVMLAVMRGTDPTAKSIIAVPKIDGRSKAAAQKRRERDETVKKAEANIGPLVTAYAIRASCLLGRIGPANVIAEVGNAVKAATKPNYMERDGFEQRARKQNFARSLVLLATIEGVDGKALIDHAISIFSEHEYPATEAASELFRLAQFIPGTAATVPEYARSICASWRHMKLPGRDKIDTITRYSRIALLQDESIAREAFNHAVAIAAEIDAESVHALGVCRDLARAGRAPLDDKDARRAASMLAAIANDVGERVGSDDGFPWAEIMAALARLDLPWALATSARFDETGLASLGFLLDPVLVEALDAGSLGYSAATALLPLAGYPETDVVEALARHGIAADREAIDYLARDILCGRESDLADLAGPLGLQTASATGPWAAALVAAIPFVAKLPDKDRRVEYPGRRSRRRSPRFNFDWATINSADDLRKAIARERKKARKDEYLYDETLLAIALDAAPAHRQADGLDYVVSDPEGFGYTFHLGDLVDRRTREWSANPAIADWCRNKLPGAIAQHLANVARYIEMDRSSLPALLDRTGVTGSRAADIILAGIEQQIDELGSAQIYRLTGEIARHAPPEAAAAALLAHITRRSERMPPTERSMRNMPDIPTGTSPAVARLLFAALGSPIAPRRWLAAHAVRRLARLGAHEILGHLVAGYGRRDDPSFGHPDAPFYFLNAKLWLLIALARAALETPAAIAPYRDFLFGVAEAADFPHVLVRAFAQQGLRALEQSDPSAFSDADRARIEAINRSPLRRRKRPKSASYVTFEKYAGDVRKGRKFPFDTLDTLPYFYESAVDGFANPNGSAFLKRAEHWILQEWNGPTKPFEIDQLRRGTNLWDRRGMSTSSSHGSLPSIERYRTYLELHAMYCAVGDFLATKPLRSRSEEYEDDQFETWLERQGLTAPPIWLSDLRGPKPLEPAQWRAPDGTSAWLHERTETDIANELMPGDAHWIVIAADSWTSEDRITATVRVESCLVSPETASSFRRAMEASENSYTYRLAVGGGDRDIDHGDFRLRSILRDRDGDRQIDRHDRSRGELTAPTIGPLPWVLDYLELTPCSSGLPLWRDTDGREAMRTTGWSDETKPEHERYHYFHAHGSRLIVRRDLLARLMDGTGLDLAVELTMQRSIGNRYEQSSEDQDKETEYDRIFIYRRDGSIEDSSGNFRRWREDRTRTRNSRSR